MKEIKEIIEAILLCVVILVMLIVMMYCCYYEGYQHGQIDALNGKIKFEKKENEDGETVWTEKSEK